MPRDDDDGAPVREPLIAVDGRMASPLSQSFISLDKLPGVSVEDRLLGDVCGAVPTLTVLTVVFLIHPGTRDSKEVREKGSAHWMTLLIVGYAGDECGGEPQEDTSESGGVDRGEGLGGWCSESLGE